MRDKDKVLLRFKATPTSLELLDENRKITVGSKGVLRASFTLTALWQHMDRVVAAFYTADGTEHAALLEKGFCDVPDEVTDSVRFKVQLVGMDQDGATVYSGKATVKQVR